MFFVGFLSLEIRSGLPVVLLRLTVEIIDEEAAAVVKEIFHLCVQGYGVTQIANEISKRHIMNPTAHAKENGCGISANWGDADDYRWGKQYNFAYAVKA